MKRLEFRRLWTTKTLATSARLHGKQSDISEGYGHSHNEALHSDGSGVPFCKNAWLRMLLYRDTGSDLHL